MAYKILAVDDEAHILHVVSLKLRNAGFEVLTAQDGQEALETTLAERPDLIITDYQMPRMDGMELCKALQEQSDVPGVPIILLSARGFDVAPEDMAASGIVDVLEKPFSPREILSRVEELLQARPSQTEETVS